MTNVHDAGLPTARNAQVENEEIRQSWTSALRVQPAKAMVGTLVMNTNVFVAQTIPHTIHVWCIYLHENHKNQPFM